MTTENLHFKYPADWPQAGDLLDFEPVKPAYTAGLELASLAVLVRDHRQRELPRGERSLEAHYGDFVFSQALRARDEARRQALETAYGPAPQAIRIAGREARSYELGPEVAPGDIDPRNPAVVAWYDDELFYLLASDKLDADVLATIAESIYR